MPTYTALTTLAGKPAADALGEALEMLDPAPTGVGVFEIEDGSGLWEVGVYFTDPPDGIALDLLAAVHGAGVFAVSEVPDVDWVAHVRRELHPVTAGRFFVYGTHDADAVPADVVPLRVEAAMAFGTGHHGTTQGCLTALEGLIAAGHQKQAVADIGCGTAVLAMAAAKVWSGQVMASDIDAVAVEVAEANVAANALDGRVTVIEAAGFEHPALAKAGPFDLIFANILKGPLIELAPQMFVHTSNGGHVILSGILRDQAEEVLWHYQRSGYNLADCLDIGDWTTTTLLKTT